MSQINLDNIVNNFLSSSNSTKNFSLYATNNTGGSTGLQLGQINFQPNINWYPSTISTISTDSTLIYYDPEDKKKIFELIQKIIDGGRKQLIYSLKSSNELEKSIALMLLDFLKVWKTEEVEEKNHDNARC